jgi:hypothetical protein
VFSGGTTEGRVYERAYLNGGEALVGTRLQGGDSVSLDLDTVPLPVPADAPVLEGFSVRTERGGMGISIPFAAGNVYYIDDAAGLWHGHGHAFRLFRSSLAGGLLMEIALQTEPAPVTAAELAAWEASESVVRFREMGGKIDMDRIPKVKPFFDGIMVDPDGFLWVSVPAGPLETRFRIFDRDGRYLGPIRVDGLTLDSFVPPVVRNGRLHVVGRDELDVQRVHVLTIER